MKARSLQLGNRKSPGEFIQGKQIANFGVAAENYDNCKPL